MSSLVFISLLYLQAPQGPTNSSSKSADIAIIVYSVCPSDIAYSSIKISYPLSKHNDTRDSKRELIIKSGVIRISLLHRLDKDDLHKIVFALHNKNDNCVCVI